MIDLNNFDFTGDESQIKEIKQWLIQENNRLKNERRELELAQKRLRDESLFFENKFQILQDGFRKLEADRLAFEKKKKIYIRDQFSRGTSRQSNEGANLSVMEEAVRLLFRSVHNPLALRKRYRDLVKIFHPDNLFGDEELAQMINKEYIRRKREE